MGAAIDNEQVSLNEQQCLDNKPQLPCSGEAIEHVVEKFYNLYNPQDNMLAYEKILVDATPLNWFDFLFFTITYPSPYLNIENDIPLGAYGIQNGINEPENYKEYNVLSKILNEEDSDQRKGCDLSVNLKHFGYIFGNFYWCTINQNGDNHFGYMGFRDINDKLKEEGAINVVVNNWLSE